MVDRDDPAAVTDADFDGRVTSLVAQEVDWNPVSEGGPPFIPVPGTEVA